MYAYLGLLFSVVLFFLMFLFLKLGNWIGLSHLGRLSQLPPGGVNIAENAVLGLLALLIAFTFAGSNAKFDHRRELIVSEVNAIHSAYLRVDMLSPHAQTAMHQHLIKYIESRINFYRAFPNLDVAHKFLEESAQIEDQLWQEAVTGCKENNQAACIVLLPALTNMIDLAEERTAVLKMHPPIIIFALLVGLALMSALLAGYSMAEQRELSYLHIISYVAITAITIYVVLDMEYPRYGLIRLDPFDQLLVELHDSMVKAYVPAKT